MGENSAITSKSYLSLCLDNIHKVIDPLFLDDLQEEFATVKQSARNRKKNLLAFQDKLASINIFDPACGSGNFLTESYLSLRRLKNETLKELFGSQIQLGELLNPIKISIAQFFGIEINDFAVAVAQTALWIAELQMIQDTQQIIHRDLDFLPLKSYSNIHEANALRTDWKKICPQPNFIIGNPPFVGKSFQTPAQKILDVRANYPNATLADLYDPLTIPADLRKAHRSNDKAVAADYDCTDILDDEPAIVAALLKLYKKI